MKRISLPKSAKIGILTAGVTLVSAVLLPTSFAGKETVTWVMGIFSAGWFFWAAAKTVDDSSDKATVVEVVLYIVGAICIVVGGLCIALILCLLGFA